MIKEFKEFIMRGNVIDLAVGVIVGAAFGKIVNSLVNDLIMPVITLITGKVDFTNLFVALDGKEYDTLATAKESTSVIAYGSFIQMVIEFLIIAFCIFVLVKTINKMKRPKKEEAPAEAKTCPYCKSADLHLEATKCPHCGSSLDS